MPRNEEVMKNSVFHNGPLTVAVAAACDAFRFYSKGIFHDESCSTLDENLDHAVLVVGYGEENGRPYWLVKNSYGAHWGEVG